MSEQINTEETKKLDSLKIWHKNKSISTLSVGSEHSSYLSSLNSISQEWILESTTPKHTTPNCDEKDNDNINNVPNRGVGDNDHQYDIQNSPKSIGMDKDSPMSTKSGNDEQFNHNETNNTDSKIKKRKKTSKTQSNTTLSSTVSLFSESERRQNSLLFYEAHGIKANLEETKETSVDETQQLFQFAESNKQGKSNDLKKKNNQNKNGQNDKNKNLKNGNKNDNQNKKIVKNEPDNKVKDIQLKLKANPDDTENTYAGLKVIEIEDKVINSAETVILHDDQTSMPSKSLNPNSKNLKADNNVKDNKTKINAQNGAIPFRSQDKNESNNNKNKKQNTKKQENKNTQTTDKSISNYLSKLRSTKDKK